MKKILITGLNSYTGNAISEHLSAWPEKYQVSRISLRGDSWKSENFRDFDTVIHTAGIAHDSTKHSDKHEYYRVNSSLTFEAARKAARDGVRQFVFMSSSIVYGRPDGIITRDTPVNPESFYGDSKVRAENLILPLEAEGLRVCILRCPMIYGRNCKGNYPVLSKIARHVPFFPKVHNQRSMLYVKNFADFVRLMIENDESGTFWPQNGEYSQTSELVKMIAEVHGRKIILVPFCEIPLKVLARFSGLVNKAFSSLAYDMELSEYKENYRLYTLKQSVQEAESGLQQNPHVLQH
ncbi:MAG: NAD-dependent epimerase/dehydratase family protein [Synergistaceae bacterium]|nr:NAD-dependent epimerase/dehydratase family protein [Synergistaceae bacterium]